LGGQVPSHRKIPRRKKFIVGGGESKPVPQDNPVHSIGFMTKTKKNYFIVLLSLGDGYQKHKKRQLQNLRKGRWGKILMHDYGLLYRRETEG